MRPHGRASVNATAPVAQAQCDRCGFWYNRTDLMWQYQWAGTHIYSLGVLVCKPCYDTPQEQLRTIILPPDPPPVINARPPNFTYEESQPAIQGALAATAPAGATVLNLQAANGPALQSAGAFTVGQTVWVQLTDAVFGQYQITVVDPIGNSLTIEDLNGEGTGLSAPAPINGTVTVAITRV